MGFGSLALGSSLPLEVEGKIRAVTSLWAYEREEFIRLTRISESQKTVLTNLLDKEQDKKIRKGIALLLALNCVAVNPAISPFEFLESYRCKNGPFELFSSQSLVSFEDTYVLAFVKEQDRPRTISFLKRYIRFWKDEANKKDGVVIGESDLEYLLEIVVFLEKGGYH
ncbi:MAG: hypothetical protein ACREIS_01260 [Nitrospiraceae bacterium]